ncbi:hypothetical protein [Nakamurella panacisegetis]|nr:hypothetical protein [Nakamurella panacisegetis]
MFRERRRPTVRGGVWRLAAGLTAVLITAACATSVSGSASPVAGAVDLPSSTAATGPITIASTAPTGISSHRTSSASPTVVSHVPRTTGTDSTSRPSEATTGGKMDGPTFARKLEAANATVKTVRGSLSMASSTISMDGTFSETLSGPSVSGLSMSVFIKAGGQSLPMSFLLVGGKVYLGGDTVLAAVGAGSKKWALASTASSNSTLRALAQQMDGLTTSAGVSQYRELAAAATAIQDGGVQKVAGKSAHRYTLTTLTSGEVDVWVDSSFRLVRVATNTTMSGSKTAITMTVSGYNSAVVIKVPPAADVFTG